jgi:DNA polymerase III subunit gamma/tau
MEKFIVSARKYRPQTFDTVVGQDHITTTLKNAIRSGHLAHAFLFCGPRGVGKTTCARILAKTINCENVSSDGEACNECHSCISFNEGTSLNIHELDAASNNSVEDIRNLADQVRFPPQAGTYKVYIIDEVHMLSASAFNAFLKTLEEPPPYAIFILATTEKHKILPTILSRCQIFDFKRITLKDTIDHLQGIANKENFNTEETALQLIAQKSEGCMRDSLSILDKIVSFTNGEVNYANTIEHLNILDADYYFKLMDCMLEQDLAGAMLLYNDIDSKGFEGDMVLNGFAEFTRNLLICKDERVAGLLEVVESFRQRFIETAKRTDGGYLVSVLNILNDSEINYRSARNKRLHVELALIKLCYLKQALELTMNGNELSKKKITDTARAVGFKNITPIAAKPAASQAVEAKAKLVIEASAPPPPVQQIQPIQPIQPAQSAQAAQTAPVVQASQPPLDVPRLPVPQPVLPVTGKKISSLQQIRETVAIANGNAVPVDQALTEERLKKAWHLFIEILKKEKNSAWQSFETSTLRIRDANIFEAIVNMNINQRFLEFERNKASDFLKKELSNKQIQFLITLEEGEKENIQHGLPLSSREQYQKLVEEYPIVKELRDKLRLELDY